MPDFLKPQLLTPKSRLINSTSGQRKNTYSELNCPFKTESVLKLLRQIFLLPTHRYMFVLLHDIMELISYTHHNVFALDTFVTTGVTAPTYGSDPLPDREMKSGVPASHAR